jgi:hypothetical protein
MILADTPLDHLCTTQVGPNPLEILLVDYRGGRHKMILADTPLDHLYALRKWAQTLWKYS